MLCYCINSVDAGKASRFHGKHLGVGVDSGYRGSSTASTDLGYGGSSTATTSIRSTSHLVECYQKMSMHPLAEGKLKYA